MMNVSFFFTALTNSKMATSREFPALNTSDVVWFPLNYNYSIAE